MSTNRARVRKGNLAWRKGEQLWQVVVNTEQESIQDSQMAWSQQGRRKAFRASLLQMAHRSLKGISS